jgi:hypothetical protein
MADAVAIQARIDELDTAIASGVLVIRHGNDQTTFRSLAEMERIRATLQSELRAANATPRRQRFHRIYQVSKGY